LRTSHLSFSDGYAKSKAMPSNPTPSNPDRPQPRPVSEAVADPAGPRRQLPPAAQRALAEAAARRAERASKILDQPKTLDQPKEVGGRDGPDPTRYGDWELNGIASDF
jgi:hypothetical protein